MKNTISEILILLSFALNAALMANFLGVDRKTIWDDDIVLKQIDAKSAWQMADSQPVVFIDVRSPSEFAQGSVSGSFNLPRSQFVSGIASQIALDTPVFICPSTQDPQAAILLQRLLLRTGHRNVYTIAGGFSTWSAELPGAVQGPSSTHRKT